MGYCLSCGRLRDTVNGWCRQCNEDNMLRKHPGWKTKREVLAEQKRQQAKEAKESLI